MFGCSDPFFIIKFHLSSLFSGKWPIQLSSVSLLANYIIQVAFSFSLSFPSIFGFVSLLTLNLISFDYPLLVNQTSRGLSILLYFFSPRRIDLLIYTLNVFIVFYFINLSFSLLILTSYIFVF